MAAAAMEEEYALRIDLQRLPTEIRRVIGKYACQHIVLDGVKRREDGEFFSPGVAEVVWKDYEKYMLKISWTQPPTAMEEFVWDWKYTERNIINGVLDKDVVRELGEPKSGDKGRIWEKLMRIEVSTCILSLPAFSLCLLSSACFSLLPAY
jgi:hypothetical protein